MEQTIATEEIPTTQDTTLPYVTRISHGISNSYLITDSTTGNWVLVDAGMPTSAKRIQDAAEARFGSRKPVAIVLTHGHFDHVGAVKKLAQIWDVPVYAHLLEHPYLDGRSSYPPPDPTVGGGFIAAVMSRFFPRSPIDLGPRLQSLPEDRSVPGMQDWRWIHTPGHSPGHISLFREGDSALIAGDAFVTTKQESLFSVLCQHQEVSRPPAYFTSDWNSAQRSIEILTSLQPSVAATGHGIPIYGQELQLGLDRLTANFAELKPQHGRYINLAAQSDQNGLLWIPPAAPDPLARIAIAAALGYLIGSMAKRNSHS